MSKDPIPKKSLGQHWLNDEFSLLSMVAAGRIVNTDTVLEIGPGLGSLTRLLVPAAAQVTAVEFDPILANNLANRLGTPANLRVEQNDILSFDLATMAPDYKVVANIPYYLTSKLVRVLSESSNRPSTAVLLVQKEVAERLAARPGDLSILGVTAQFYWDIRLGEVVKAELFTPPPKVDSQIVIMQRRSDPFADLAGHGATSDQIADFNVRGFFRIVKAGFGARRKTLSNSLGGGLHLGKAETAALLAAAGIDGGLRAQNLSLVDWYTLYHAYQRTAAG